jgi:hypothetical protein
MPFFAGNLSGFHRVDEKVGQNQPQSLSGHAERDVPETHNPGAQAHLCGLGTGIVRSLPSPSLLYQ